MMRWCRHRLCLSTSFTFCVVCCQGKTLSSSSWPSDYAGNLQHLIRCYGAGFGQLFGANVAAALQRRVGINGGMDIKVNADTVSACYEHSEEELTRMAHGAP